MAKRRVTVQEFTCDNPECPTENRQQYVEKGEVPQGITLKGFFDLGWGGGPIELFVCSPSCVSPAIAEVLGNG